ncbi:MAG: type II toxin-antitoxin system VapC family toxin [Pseudomonadota bacterium]|nr:type II toxin-antitoxin system VapC family toxin [Pseudomonadota bacterium]
MAAGLTCYFDTSALLKLYLEEAESARVRQAVAAATFAFTHLITYAEMRAGLAQAARLRRIDGLELARQVEQFETDWSELRVITPNETHIRRAGELAQRFGLRGYDSVHLAAAEAVWQALPGVDFRFAAFDARLMAAAKTLGMRGLE